MLRHQRETMNPGVGRNMVQDKLARWQGPGLQGQELSSFGKVNRRGKARCGHRCGARGGAHISVACATMAS